MDQQVIITQSIYKVKASNKEKALLTDIRKKNIINIITIIMTFRMLELLNCLPAVCETDFQFIRGDFQLITSDFQLIRAAPQRTIHCSISTVVMAAEPVDS